MHKYPAQTLAALEAVEYAVAAAAAVEAGICVVAKSVAVAKDSFAHEIAETVVYEAAKLLAFAYGW